MLLLSLPNVRWETGREIFLCSITLTGQGIKATFPEMVDKTILEKCNLRGWVLTPKNLAYFSSEYLLDLSLTKLKKHISSLSSVFCSTLVLHIKVLQATVLEF